MSQTKAQLIEGLNVNASAPADSLVIDSSGKVGLGTSSPDQLLHISNSSGPVIRIENTDTSLTTNDLIGGVEFETQDPTSPGAGVTGGIKMYAADTFGGQSYMTFSTTNGSSKDNEVMRISNTGNVGIGTTSASANLHVSASSGTAIKITETNNGVTGAVQASASGPLFGSDTNHPIAFYTNAVERFRCDTSGRLLVGTSSTSADTRAIIQGRSAAVDSTGKLYISSGNNTPANEDGIAELNFSPSNHTATASIAVQRDGGTWTAGSSQPSRLVFSTTADGASSPTTRVIIDNAGRFKAQGVYDNTTVAAANVWVDTDGSLRRSTSSIKYKADVETLEDKYADAILNVRPVWYRSTAPFDNADWGWWGFIAEEVAAIDPRLVQWKTSETKAQEDGSLVTTELEKPEPEGVQYDRFVPHLLNLIKRQKEQIEAMEARLSALEA